MSNPATIFARIMNEMLRRYEFHFARGTYEENTFGVGFCSAVEQAFSLVPRPMVKPLLDLLAEVENNDRKERAESNKDMDWDKIARCLGLD